ncbi:hypothetical protein EYZ11_011721 [Aspergillus tanneri]|uniref:Uncharacterized protein n=1 Tax=Aspergillus tanneri TaxID=1220188 RepID=A0A4S3J482_9EURO|nr:hypothetical protein EYZ11_011721 [Aspergillus tanneri]
MDVEAAERLKNLQMEDLGTARREFISTSDKTKLRNVSLSDIEASRMSNVAGSEAQRTAQANKEKLSEWNNVHKKIGDTDSERLDNLLDGQTHRLHLSALVLEAGGQSYAKTAGKRDKSSQIIETKSKRITAASRALSSTGQSNVARAKVPKEIPTYEPAPPMLMVYAN